MNESAEAVAWLEEFYECSSQNSNPYSGNFIGLVDDHYDDCPCEYKGEFFTKARSIVAWTYDASMSNWYNFLKREFKVDLKKKVVPPRWIA
jgi:hypothetical protein